MVLVDWVTTHRSSAYVRERIVWLPMVYPPEGMESAALIRGSITKLKSTGLRGQPCYTPLLHGMGAVRSLPVRTHIVEPV